MQPGLFGLFRTDPGDPAPDEAAALRRVARAGAEVRRAGQGALALAPGMVGGGFHEDAGLLVAVLGRVDPEESAPPASDAGLIAAVYRARGQEGVAALRGCFAAALIDRIHHRCLLLRDSFGRWPVYALSDERALAFGTSLAPMLAAGLFPRSLDPAAAVAYFRYGFVPSPMTLLKGVRLIGPGAQILASGQGHRLASGAVRLDRPDDVKNLKAHDDQVRTLLEERVIRRFEGRSDLVQPLRPDLSEQVLLRLLPLRTRSLGPELPAGDPAARAAQMADRGHAELGLEPDHSDLDRVLAAYEQPIASPDGLRADAVIRWAKRQDASVVDATGGGALFAAEPRYPEILVQDAIRRSLPHRLQRLGERRLGRRLLGTTEEDLFAEGPGLSWLSDEVRLSVSEEPALFRRTDGTVPSLQQLDLELGVGAQRAPTRQGLAALHGIDWAMPFLDRRLAHTVGAWPMRARTEGPEAGVGLKRVARTMFGALALEPEPGPDGSVDAWLRGRLREPAEALFFGRSGGASGVLHPRRVRRAWYAHQLGRSSGAALFGLLMFEWACHRLFDRSR